MPLDASPEKDEVRAVIYTNRKTRERWMREAKRTKYKTFNNLARIAIELLLTYPNLPEHLAEPETPVELSTFQEQINALNREIQQLSKQIEPLIEEQAGDDFFDE